MYISSIGFRFIIFNLRPGLALHRIFSLEPVTNHVELLLITGYGCMISALDLASSVLGSSPFREHRVVF